MAGKDTQEKLAGPNQMAGEKLRELGVQMLNKFDLQLQCKTCGMIWSPQLSPEANLPEGYWRCPNRCNW
jgi:hypothetical protein